VGPEWEPRHQGPRCLGYNTTLFSQTQGGWEDGLDNEGNGFNDDLIGWNFRTNTNDPLDDHGHGTHVSGTVGAIGNNNRGVVGVNWKVQLMAVKFLSEEGSGTSIDGALAIRYAADNGAVASNNSWGGGGFSSTLYNAIQHANDKNHLVVAAAGNHSANTDVSPHYPSAFNLANIIAVASTTSSGGFSSFTNYGETSVDLAAPGSGIYSTVPNGHAYLSGTSMATPHVAGTVALVAGLHPDWSLAQIKEHVLENVTPVPTFEGKLVSPGIVNAAEAVKDAPEILLRAGGNSVLVASTVDFGTAFVGQPLTRTFTVKNVGSQPLTLGNTITVPAGFSLVSGFAATTLASGDSTSFSVRLDASSGGT
jgi:subtilisin family serine protease